MISFKKRALCGAAAAALLLGVAATGATASAQAKPLDFGRPVTLASGLALPLGLSVSSDGVLVAQSGSGQLTKLGQDAPVATATGAAVNAIDGVDWAPGGSALYTSSGGSSEDPEANVLAYANLSVVRPNGTTSVLTDIKAVEDATNPDQVNSYGFQDLPEGCTPEAIPAEPYNGLVDAHPYGVGYYGYGFSVVADAAANVLWVIAPDGSIFNTVVLPPQPVTVDADFATGNELPECTIGSTYNFEPVPTDVELGPYGYVFVTLLPGGPEDPSAGARGSLIAVNPVSGQIIPIASGLAGATGLAVTPYGVVVNQLFGNMTSLVIQGGTVLPLQSSIPAPAAVEWAVDRVWVTNDVFGPDGKVTVLL